MNNRRVWLGIGLSLFFFYLMIWKPQPGSMLSEGVVGALFGHPRLDLREIWSALVGVNMTLILLAFLVTPVHMIVRSHRWVILLRPIGHLLLIDSFSLEMVGQVANSVLPLRIGEVARGALLGPKMGVAKTTGIATVVLERMLDLLCALILTGVVGAVYPFPPAVKDGAIVLGGGVVIGLAVMFYLVFARDPFDGIAGRLVAVLPRKIELFVRDSVTKFSSGFSILKAGRHYSLVLGESLLIWLLYALQVYLVINAFHFPKVYPAIGAMPLLTSLVMLVISAMILSLPSAPGGMGTFHAAMMFGLAIFEVPADPAAGFALVIHAITVIGYLLFGLPFMWREGVRFGELRAIEKGI